MPIFIPRILTFQVLIQFLHLVLNLRWLLIPSTFLSQPLILRNYRVFYLLFHFILNGFYELALKFPWLLLFFLIFHFVSHFLFWVSIKLFLFLSLPCFFPGLALIVRSHPCTLVQVIRQSNKPFPLSNLRRNMKDASFL